MSMTLQSTYNSAPPIAYAGQLEGTGHDIKSMVSVDTASIPFGSPVAFKPTPVSDQDAYLPAAGTDNIAGIVAMRQAYARKWTDSDGNVHGELDDVGLMTGAELNVVRRGRVAVLCQTNVAVGDRPYVSYNATGATYTAPGQIGNAAEVGHTIDCTTKGEFVTSASAGGFAWLDCNFVAK